MIDQFHAILTRLRAEDAAMTPGPWLTGLPDVPHLVYAESEDADGPIATVHYPPQVDNAQAIAALRNRNARLLDLLEALVEERHWNLAVDRNVAGSLGSYFEAARRTDDALRVFVETEQEVPK